MKSDTIRRKFEDASPEEKQKNVLQLIALLHCNADRGISLVSTSAGRMNSVSFESNYKHIQFVDTSVTGMYERRTNIEL